MYTMSTISIVPVVVAMVILTISGSAAIRVKEGEHVGLNFQYPCENSAVTLCKGHIFQLYSSANDNPEATPLHRRYLVTNKKDTRLDNCILHLTIDHVTREDADIYVLSSYRNGQMLPEDVRIRLDVDFHPGKASCKPRRKYHGEWVRLLCTASAGSTPGQIVCFQGGLKIPPLHEPGRNDKIIKQKLLVRQSDPLYCCSSIIEQTKYRCACKDWGWDPENDTVLNNTDPCPTVTSPVIGITPSLDPAAATGSNFVSFSLLNSTLMQTPTDLQDMVDLSKQVLYGVLLVSSVLMFLFYFILYWRRCWCE